VYASTGGGLHGLSLIKMD